MIAITDVRGTSVGVTFDNLQAGEVYVSPRGEYVLATDEYGVVDLSTGVVFMEDCYNKHSEFIPVKAKLEIY